MSLPEKGEGDPSYGRFMCLVSSSPSPSILHFNCWNPPVCVAHTYQESQAYNSSNVSHTSIFETFLRCLLMELWSSLPLCIYILYLFCLFKSYHSGEGKLTTRIIFKGVVNWKAVSERHKNVSFAL